MLKKGPVEIALAAERFQPGAVPHLLGGTLQESLSSLNVKGYSILLIQK